MTSAWPCCSTSSAWAATRDPYIFTGLENIWVNFGRTQVHLPSRAVPPKAEVLRGTAGLVVPSLEDLAKRLDYAGKEMKRVVGDARHFSYAVKKDCIETTALGARACAAMHRRRSTGRSSSASFTSTSTFRRARPRALRASTRT